MNTDPKNAFGHATEARFQMEAQLRGLLVSKPVGYAPGYTFIVDTPRRLFRVQVKGSHLSNSISVRRPTPHYQFHFAINLRRPRPFVPRFDIAACWLDNDAVWTFFPAHQCPQHFVLSKNPKFRRIRPDWRPAINDWAIFDRPQRLSPKALAKAS